MRSGVFQKGLFTSPLGEIIQGVGYTTRGCGNPWIILLESSPCTNCVEQASLCMWRNGGSLWNGSGSLKDFSWLPQTLHKGILLLKLYIL